MTEYLFNDPLRPVGLLPVAAPTYPAGSRVLTVGADKQFRTVAAAVAASKNGDVVLVDAGTYTNDFVTVRTKLTIIGVGGMVNMVATVPPPDQKAIMTVGNDLNLQNFSFSGAAIPAAAGGNAAGIRYEGGHLVLTNDAFVGNQNGLMSGAGLPGLPHDITIDHSLFSGNGSGTGYTHNLYVGAVDSLTVTNSIFEGAVVGHEFKSRALVNTIQDNLFRDGATGTASYDIDLPNGGQSTITGNVIEKGPMAQNTSMVHFGGEGLPYAGSSLLVQDNTFINDKDSRTIAVLNQSGIAVQLLNNNFQKIAADKIVSGPASLTDNTGNNGAAITNSATSALPSNSMTYTDTAAHSLTVGSTVRGVQGGAGRLTVNVINQGSIAIGGTGGMDYTEAAPSYANTVKTVANSVNSIVTNGAGTIDSRGTDTITTGKYDTTGQVSGNATITLGSAYDRWTVSGTTRFIGTGGGPFITVASGARATVNGQLGSLSLTNNGGTAVLDYTQSGPHLRVGSHLSMSISGGSSTLSVWDGVMSVTTAQGAQGAVVRLGDGVAQVNSNGQDVIWAGAGDASVVLTASGEVHAGTGNLSVFGRHISGEGARFYGNGGDYTIGGDSGNIIYYGGALASTVRANLGNITMIGGAGRMTVLGGNAEKIIGGAGGLEYDAQGGSATISTAAGSFNTLRLGVGSVDSWGTDTITGTSYNNTVVVHGNAVINGSTGNSKYTLMGNDTLNGRGSDTVTVTAGADVTVNAGTYASVTQAGATVRYNLGGAKAANAVVTGGSATISGDVTRGLFITTDAKYATDIAVTNGGASISTRGADVVHAGSGPTSVTLYAANTQVYGGDGAMTVRNEDYAASDAQTIYGGSGAITMQNVGAGAITFIGGAGNAVISGGTGRLTVTGGSGAVTLAGGAQATRFTAGSGTAAVTMNTAGGEVVFGSGDTTVQLSGGKATLFDFVAGQGGGTDIIKGFRAGTDRLVLQGGVALQSRTVSAGSTNLLLTDGTHVTLTGVTSNANLFA